MKTIIIIINSIPPYCYEINNILSLPNGFRYRFRYQKKKGEGWLPEIDNPKEMENNIGLIVLREFQETGKFIPIRNIFIDKIEVIGDIIYIEYQLKNRITFSPDESDRVRQINQFNDRINADIQLEKYPNIPRQNLKNLVFIGNDYTYDFENGKNSNKEITSENKKNSNKKIASENGKNSNKEIASENVQDSEKWGRTIELLGRFEGNGIDVYKNYDFINIRSIYDLKHKPAKIFIDKNRQYFLLENRKIYILSILQRSYSEKTNNNHRRDIELKVDDTIVKAMNPKLSLTGKYDVLDFYIRPEILSSSKNSFLLLNFYENNELLAYPSIIIPIKIEFSSIENIIKLFTIIIFIGLIIVYWFADYFTVYYNIDTLRKVLIPFMILFGGEILKIIREFFLIRI